MNRHIVRGSLALLWCATILPGWAGKETWLEVRSEHFRLISTASDKQSRQLAVQLEQFRFVLGQFFGLQPPATPVTLAVFRTDAGFTPFKPIYDGQPVASMAGFCESGAAEDLIALNVEHAPQALEIIQHEYTHMATAGALRFSPAWLSEGEAEVMSTCRLEAGKVIIGDIKKGHLLTLATQRWIPLPRLFTVSTQSPEYNERNRQNLFYAQSWALVHYLRFGDGGARREQMAKFYARLQDGRKPEAAFVEAFQIGLPEMEALLRKHINGGKYVTYHPKYAMPDFAKSLVVRRANTADVESLLGTLLINQERYADAQPYFDRAAAADPAHPRLRQARGFRAYRHRDYELARTEFAPLVASNLPNHLVHFYYAGALFNGRLANRVLRPQVDGELVRAIATACVRAVQLAPTFAPAYDLLASLYYVAGENVAEGVKAATIATRLDPGHQAYQLTLARLQLAAGDTAGAQATVEALLDGQPDPVSIESGRAILREIDRRTGKE